MDVKADLSRRDAYPALRATRVDRLETHISWVFLLDRDVFKVKKPVDLEFLDFRTVDQRKAACEAEVRLNARLAPHAYRGIVPVQLGEDGRCVFGGAGPTVDWAVHMVRLPDAVRADRLVAARQLTSENVDEIAKLLADFHASATVDRDSDGFGAASAVLRNVEENFHQAAGTIEKYLRPAEVQEITRWQWDFIEGHRELFEARIRAGRVVEGHGDLRLEHVYFDGHPPTIIDCIEFNERFRFGDVCADVAFLSMDLAGHGRVDLAERLLAAYARESNDFDLYALVDFYEGYRAFVRGKVSAMIAADPDIASEARERAEAEARRHFLLARSVQRKALLSPALVAVGGIIASGKSTLAERIGADMTAPVISSDRARKAMHGVAAKRSLYDPAWQGAYAADVTERVYAEVLRRAEVVLRSGRSVVLDASFRSREMRRAARELASKLGVPFRFVECRIDPNLARERLAQRALSPSVSDGRLEVFDEFCRRFEPVTELAPPEHLVLDTAAPVDDNARTLRAFLATWPAGFVG